MTVRITDEAIHLEGRCMVEDAEALLLALEQRPGTPVDIGGLERLHTAAAQVLFALRPAIVGTPASDFLARHIFGRGLQGDKAVESA